VGLRAISPSRTAPSSAARSTVYVWRMVESESARRGSASSILAGFILARIASTSASMSDGRSLCRGIAPNGAGSRCEGSGLVAKKVDPVAKLIHDLCVDAGAECPAAARSRREAFKIREVDPRPYAPQKAGRRGRNLTVAEAGRMCRNGR
jgi:hypothetical protein